LSVTASADIGLAGMFKVIKKPLDLGAKNWNKWRRSAA